MLQGQTWEPRDPWALSGSLLPCGQLPAWTWQKAPVLWASTSPTCKMGLPVYVRDTGSRERAQPWLAPACVPIQHGCGRSPAQGGARPQHLAAPGQGHS